MRTLFIIADTFHALRNRGLFWILLWISVLLVIVLGGFSCNEQGWQILYGLMKFPQEQPFLAAGTDWNRSFYIGFFRGFMDWWILSYALVLAMFSVTGIFPAMMRPGMVDFLLSKSVSRLGLFVGKYLGCLCVMLTQVSIVAVGGVLVLWLRMGEWHGEMLWSIPLAVLIFSFVLSVNVFMGVATRSSVAALLWTLLFWAGLWIVQKLDFDTGNETKMSQVTAVGGEHMGDTMREAHQYSRALMTVLPKTRETALLLDQQVRAAAPHTLVSTLFVRSNFSSDENYERVTDVVANEATDEHNLVRDPRYVIGSSLLFEFMVLALAYLKFRKMDF